MYSYEAQFRWIKEMKKETKGYLTYLNLVIYI